MDADINDVISGCPLAKVPAWRCHSRVKNPVVRLAPDFSASGTGSRRPSGCGEKREWCRLFRSSKRQLPFERQDFSDVPIVSMSLK